MWQLPQRLTGAVCKNLLRLEMVLGLKMQRRSTMHPLTRNWLIGFATAVTLALTVASVPAYAEELPQNLGPVGPNEPILTTVGSKRVLAFYEADGGHCGMYVLVWGGADLSGGSAARVRVTLEPRQVVHVDTPENKSLNLQCGESANTLAIVDNGNFIAGAAH
jgi:hypothetical protein